MRKETFKKAAAISMATVMAIGGSLTAMAAGIEGTGTSTGHVEKKVVNVVFPVESDNATTFNYTMDAERLVTAAGSKMSGAAVTLPSSGDTGVYFLTDTGTYANESKKLDVVNKSSVSVIVSATAKATVQDGKTSITLADSSTITGDTPQLYLGIVVGDDEKAVTADGVTATATVAGYASNFTVTSNSDGSFSYGLVASPDETKWS